MIDRTGTPGDKRPRSRIGRATAVYNPQTRRIVLVADDGHFADALAAIKELRDAVT